MNRANLPEKEIAEINKQLDAVVAQGPTASVSWLRGAFHTHEQREAWLKADLDELRGLFLASVARPLTVREAQLLYVCRVCRERYPTKFEGLKLGAFILNFGEEYAHERCLPPENKP